MIIEALASQKATSLLAEESSFSIKLELQGKIGFYLISIARWRNRFVF